MPIDIVNDPMMAVPHQSHLRFGTLKQPTKSPNPVFYTGPLNHLALNFRDSGKGGPPVVRPMLGGVQTGFHAMPNIGDDVVTMYEPGLNPIGSMSTTQSPQKLTLLQPGESQQQHSDGRVFNYLKTNGDSALINDPVAGVTATLTRSTKNIAYQMSTGTFSLTGTGAPTFAVSGHSTMTDLAVGGAPLGSNDLAVAGAALLESTLTVDGATTLESSLSFPNTSPSPVLTIGGSGIFNTFVLQSGSNCTRGRVSITVGSTIGASGGASAYYLGSINVSALFGATNPFFVVSLSSSSINYPLVGVGAYPSGTTGVFDLVIIVGPTNYTFAANTTNTGTLVNGVFFNPNPTYWASNTSGGPTTQGFPSIASGSAGTTSFVYVSSVVNTTYSIPSGTVISITYIALG